MSVLFLWSRRSIFNGSNTGIKSQIELNVYKKGPMSQEGITDGVKIAESRARRGDCSSQSPQQLLQQLLPSQRGSARGAAICRLAAVCSLMLPGGHDNFTENTRFERGDITLTARCCFVRDLLLRGSAFKTAPGGRGRGVLYFVIW